MSNEWLDRLIWVLIYGGLLALGTGLAATGAPPWLQSALVWGGAGAALLGAVLIGVRARRSDRP
jgi:hypothetical protein